MLAGLTDVQVDLIEHIVSYDLLRRSVPLQLDKIEQDVKKTLGFMDKHNAFEYIEILQSVIDNLAKYKESFATDVDDLLDDVAADVGRERYQERKQQLITKISKVAAALSRGLARLTRQKRKVNLNDDLLAKHVKLLSELQKHLSNYIYELKALPLAVRVVQTEQVVAPINVTPEASLVDVDTIPTEGDVVGRSKSERNLRQLSKRRSTIEGQESSNSSQRNLSPDSMQRLSAVARRMSARSVWTSSEESDIRLKPASRIFVPIYNFRSITRRYNQQLEILISKITTLKNELSSALYVQELAYLNQLIELLQKILDSYEKERKIYFVEDTVEEHGESCETVFKEWDVDVATLITDYRAFIESLGSAKTLPVRQERQYFTNLFELLESEVIRRLRSGEELVFAIAADGTLILDEASINKDELYFMVACITEGSAYNLFVRKARADLECVTVSEPAAEDNGDNGPAPDAANNRDFTTQMVQRINSIFQSELFIRCDVSYAINKLLQQLYDVGNLDTLPQAIFRYKELQRLIDKLFDLVSAINDAILHFRIDDKFNIIHVDPATESAPFFSFIIKPLYVALDYNKQRLWPIVLDYYGDIVPIEVNENGVVLPCDDDVSKESCVQQLDVEPVEVFNQHGSINFGDYREKCLQYLAELLGFELIYFTQLIRSYDNETIPVRSLLFAWQYQLDRHESLVEPCFVDAFNKRIPVLQQRYKDLKAWLNMLCVFSGETVAKEVLLRWTKENINTIARVLREIRKIRAEFDEILCSLAEYELDFCLLLAGVMPQLDLDAPTTCPHHKQRLQRFLDDCAAYNTFTHAVVAGFGYQKAREEAILCYAEDALEFASLAGRDLLIALQEFKKISRLRVLKMPSKEAISIQVRLYYITTQINKLHQEAKVITFLSLMLDLLDMGFNRVQSALIQIEASITQSQAIVKPMYHPTITDILMAFRGVEQQSQLFYAKYKKIFVMSVTRDGVLHNAENANSKNYDTFSKEMTDWYHRIIDSQAPLKRTDLHYYKKAAEAYLQILRVASDGLSDTMAGYKKLVLSMDVPLDDLIAMYGDGDTARLIAMLLFETRTVAIPRQEKLQDDVKQEQQFLESYVAELDAMLEDELMGVVDCLLSKLDSIIMFAAPMRGNGFFKGQKPRPYRELADIIKCYEEGQLDERALFDNVGKLLHKYSIKDSWEIQQILKQGRRILSTDSKVKLSPDAQQHACSSSMRY